MLRSKLALGLAVSLLVIVLFVEQEVTAAPEPCFGLWHHHKHKHKHKHKPEKKDDDKKDEKKDDKKDEKKDDKKDKDKKEKKEEDLKKIMDESEYLFGHYSCGSRAGCGAKGNECLFWQSPTYYGYSYIKALGKYLFQL